MTARHALTAEPWVESHFSLQPRWSAPCRGPHEAQLEALKARLLEPVLEQAGGLGLARELAWAANEAAALAWCTGFPLLAFPALMEEKIGAARKRWDRQQQLRRGRPISLAA